jgi:hypothetical protein
MDVSNVSGKPVIIGRAMDGRKVAIVTSDIARFDELAPNQTQVYEKQGNLLTTAFIYPAPLDNVVNAYRDAQMFGNGVGIIQP